MRQFQELAKPPFLALAEQFDLAKGVRTADHRADGDAQDLFQMMPGMAGSGVGNMRERREQLRNVFFAHAYTVAKSITTSCIPNA